MNRFEQLIEYVINDDEQKARELFHDIVVEKSREIYENLMAEEAEEDLDESKDEEELDEAAEEDLDESGRRKCHRKRQRTAGRWQFLVRRRDECRRCKRRRRTRDIGRVGHGRSRP